MKNKFCLIGLMMLLFISCSVPKYLPTSEKIDVNEYGSFIDVVASKKSSDRGELIAIDDRNIFVLSNISDRCVMIPLSDVRRFSLRYAKPRNYSWTIPVFTLSTLSHGIWLIISAPVNLIVTISVSATGENAFQYSDRNMSFEKLKMFARFPQGIPANINLADIK